MKVTLTEHGVEFRRRVLLAPPSEHSRPLQPIVQKHARTAGSFFPSKPASAVPGKSHNTLLLPDSEQLMDSLLPAMITQHPPTEVHVKRPQIYVSHEFQRKFYPKTPDPILPARTKLSFSGSPSHAWMRQQQQFMQMTGSATQQDDFPSATQSPPQPWRLLYQTVQQFRPETAQNPKNAESEAVKLLTKSLKRSYVQKKQDVVLQQRSEMERRLKYVLFKKRNTVDHLLNSYTTEIEGDLRSEPKMPSPQTDKKRYKDRISHVHATMVHEWSYLQRTQKLAQPKESHRHTPFALLRLSQTRHIQSSQLV